MLIAGRSPPTEIPHHIAKGPTRLSPLWLKCSCVHPTTLFTECASSRQLSFSLLFCFWHSVRRSHELLPFVTWENLCIFGWRRTDKCGTSDESRNERGGAAGGSFFSKLILPRIIRNTHSAEEGVFWGNSVSPPARAHGPIDFILSTKSSGFLFFYNAKERKRGKGQNKKKDTPSALGMIV